MDFFSTKKHTCTPKFLCGASGSRTRKGNTFSSHRQSIHYINCAFVGFMHIDDEALPLYITLWSSRHPRQQSDWTLINLCKSWTCHDDTWQDGLHAAGAYWHTYPIASPFSLLLAPPNATTPTKTTQFLLFPPQVLISNLGLVPALSRQRQRLIVFFF